MALSINSKQTLTSLYRYSKKLSYFFLPNHCWFCESLSETLLCSICSNSLRAIEHPCARCALPLASTDLNRRSLCAECVRRNADFDHIHCAYQYTHELAYLIKAFKDNKHLHIGRHLVQQLIDDMRLHVADTGAPDLLIPVPLHWVTQIKRGYNQSHQIAIPLSKHLDIPLINAVQRRKNDQRQKTLNRKQREKNIRNVFSLKTKYIKDIREKHVVIVDDVVTTTATVSSIARLLKDNGASTVDVWALARTPKDFRY